MSQFSGQGKIRAVGDQQTCLRVLQQESAAVFGKRRIKHQTNFAGFQNREDGDE